MNAIWARIQDEPAMTYALIEACIVVAVSFGLPLTADQKGALLVLSAVLIGWLTRKAVTPVSAATIAAAPAKP